MSALDDLTPAERERYGNSVEITVKHPAKGGRTVIGWRTIGGYYEQTVDEVLPLPQVLLWLGGYLAMQGADNGRHS